MKKPNETRFKHNFVIAAVLAIFLLATGCPNTNKPGGTDKPQGGTDIQTPNTPDQTTPETPSTEGEASGGEAGETEEGDKTVKLTIKDLKEAVDGYEPTKEAAFIKGKVLKGVGKDDDAAIAKLKAKVAKELVKLNASTEYQYKLFNKDGGTIADTDYADDGVLTIGRKSLSALKIVIKNVKSAVSGSPGSNVTLPAGYTPTTVSIFAVAGTGKTVRAYVPGTADAAAKKKALKEAVDNFVKERTDANKIHEFALFKAVLDSAGNTTYAPLKEEDCEPGAEICIAWKGKTGKVKITVMKTSLNSTGVQVTALGNGGNKTYTAPAAGDIVEAVYGELESDEVDLSDPASVSTGLKNIIEEKAEVTLKAHNDTGTGVFVLVTVDPLVVGTPVTAAPDLTNGLKNGDKVYIVKKKD